MSINWPLFFLIVGASVGSHLAVHVLKEIKFLIGHMISRRRIRKWRLEELHRDISRHNHPSGQDT